MLIVFQIKSRRMPSTRSSLGHAQAKLDFPRRKSSRIRSLSKMLPPEEPVTLSPVKPKPQEDAQTLAQGRPRLTPVPSHSPGAVRPPPPSPRAQPRLPLSPRKRTGGRRSFLGIVLS